MKRSIFLILIVSIIIHLPVSFQTSAADIGGKDFFYANFDQDNWYSLWGMSSSPSRATLVTSPVRSGKTLKLSVPSGSHESCNFTYSISNINGGSAPEEIYWRYYIYVPSVWTRGGGGNEVGKIPGVASGKAASGCKPIGDSDWSARMVNFDFGSEHLAGFYVYHQGLADAGECGNKFNFSTKFRKDSWNCIEGYCKVNTIGSSNGILRGWLNGVQVMEKTNIMFRKGSSTSGKINIFWFHVYVGGTWTAPHDMHIYFDDLVIAHSRIGTANGSGWVAGINRAGTTPSNPAPVVSLTSPASGSTYLAPASIAVSASASDSNGTVSKVEFLNGSSLLGTDTSSPYALTWSNVSAGSYTLSARATDNAGASSTSSGVSVTVNASSSSSSSGSPTGSLSVTKAVQPTSVSLSNEGTRDWSHWGLNTSTDWNRKSGITAQISNITKVGTATLNRYTDGTCANSWTGGTPTGSVTSTRAGIYVAGVNNGFQITVPADTAARTLRIYCGVWKSQGRLEATLSDGSAPAILDTSHESTTGSANTMFTLNYRAASAGQTLTVRWSVQTSHDTAGAGTAGWQAATLQ